VPPADIIQVETSNIGKVHTLHCTLIHCTQSPSHTACYIALAVLPPSTSPPPLPSTSPPPTLAHPFPLCSSFFTPVSDRPPGQRHRRCLCQRLHRQHYSQHTGRH
jgi:hypothetical protein